MSATAEQIELVCLLMGDKEAYGIFSEDDISKLLDLADGNVYRAAARALYSIAANTALTLKVLTILDVHTDGKATAEGIIEAADKLDELADEEDENTIVCGSCAGALPYLPTHLRPWWEALA